MNVQTPSRAMEATSCQKHSPLSWFTSSFFEKLGKEIWTCHASATNEEKIQQYVIALPRFFVQEVMQTHDLAGLCK